MHNDIKLIIFDFDGTIADCKGLHQYAFRTAFETVLPGETYDEESLEGLPTREKMRRLSSTGLVFDHTEFNRIKQHLTLTNLDQYIEINPELNTELKRLSSIAPLALCTNATAKFIYHSLDRMECREYFSRINTATNFPAKPDPYTFVEAMGHFSANHRSTVIFEDSPVGLECARKVCRNVIAVTDVADTINRMKDIK